jgi:large subunit ribosomal protein L15
VLESFEAGAVVDMAVLAEKGLIKVLKDCAGLKVLGNGTLTKAITVKAERFSASAKEAIEKAGGKAEQI